jgi:predicted RNA methylase
MEMPQISEAVLKVLDAGQYDGSKFVLVGQLDRKLYTDTNKVLEAAGGKWNRSAQAHVFDGDAIEALEPIMLTGAYSRTKQDFGQFDTPEDLAAEIVAMAGIEPGIPVLEPSAGIGRIAAAAGAAGGRVTCFEIDPKRAEKLRDIAKAVNISDFLAAHPSDGFSFDRVVMNPPFAKQADIHHVLHAFKFLKSGGRLVSIMSSGVMFRDNKLTSDFREFVYAHNGSIERLPEDSFKSSGTTVNTCVVTMEA